MSAHSHIEWTEASWNPVTGCSKVSPGCANCYAERMALRLQAMGHKNYRNGFKVETHDSSLAVPAKWRKPKMIFVNSMSDLFHEDVPDAFIKKVFSVMNNVQQHTYQILTKRPERLIEISSKLKWTTNIWAGVSVESEDYLYRIQQLSHTPAYVKFVSFEPLIGPITSFDDSSIDWVIVGGESGPKARPMKEEWVLKIRDICFSCEIPFFFKQWGGVHKKLNGRLLEGVTWSDIPVNNKSNIEMMHKN